MAVPAPSPAARSFPPFTPEGFQVALLGQTTQAGGDRVLHLYLLGQLLNVLQRG
jgi:hypothetical protein